MNMKQASLRLCMGFAVVSMISACGNAAAPAKTDKEGPASASTAAPFEVTWMTELFAPEPIKADDPRIKKVEALTGTKLSINWVPSQAYSDKVNTSIAGGDLPKVLSVSDIRMPVISNAVKSGVFWELGPYLDAYPNLKRMESGILDGTKYGGKIYGIYRYRPLSREAVIIRKDWLDALGLPLPKTPEDLYNIAKAFTEQDPDKNGKKDTYGFTDASALYVLNYMNLWQGGYNKWGIEKGVFVPNFMTPAYMQAMKSVKRLYDEKLINQDFIIAKNNQSEENFAGGKAGIIIGAYNILDRTYGNLTKLFPQAKVELITQIQGVNGPKVIGGSGHNGINLIPKNTVKTEEDLKKVLAFLDKICGEEIQNILRWGIEGTDYTMVNGKAKDLTKDTVHFSSYRQLRMLEDKLIPAELSGLAERYAQVEAENDKIAVLNMTNGLESKTYSEMGGTLDKNIEDARNKFLLGAIDEKGFQKAIDDWKKAGGDKVIEEYSKQYAERGK
ncbi:extracellular solute-binding protein [Paenibacillus thalictri]|uniref:Extracellular solute-binding protein n=1 Tax=Paenibacillus thalictri TaxID=2527873 RepID=A0A4Q9DY47_9BACL|nr:extracellular solute-binding protein [Paenibacillus thalictri]TBL80758.1 extracellular solute-binding protein [Paenibacillus thalictri]